jgi:hypothetical protein
MQHTHVMMKEYGGKMRRTVILAVLISVMLAAAACGRGNREPTPEPAPAVEQATEAPTTAPEPTPTEEPTAAPEPAEEAEAATDEENDAAASAQESPLSAQESPLSAMDSPLFTPPPMSEPTVTDETGGVMGALIVVKPTGEVLPVTEQFVALGEIILDDQGEERFAGYSASSAPRELTNEFGQFAIGDVPPGKYVLVLDVVVSAFLLNDSETGQGRMVDIVAGEVLDLGTLQYESLPIFGYSE